MPWEVLETVLAQDTEDLALDISEEYLEDEKAVSTGAGVLSHISRFIFSPFYFVLFLLDSWVEDRTRKILRKTAHLRNTRQ